MQIWLCIIRSKSPSDSVGVKLEQQLYFADLSSSDNWCLASCLCKRLFLPTYPINGIVLLDAPPSRQLQLLEAADRL